jgi:RNA polymerase sigma-70 factor, ECF subfamily
VHDEEIRSALRRGDTDAAFRTLASAHGPAVYAMCCRIVRHPRMAEDVMQEVLLSAFRHRSQMLEIVTLRAWLMKIATRKSLDALRSARRNGRLETAVATGEPPPISEDLLVVLAKRDDARAVERCLASLEPETCAALLLRYREGIGWDAIAETLGVPLDTIRMRVQRGGLKKLRECLAAKEVMP